MLNFGSRAFASTVVGVGTPPLLRPRQLTLEISTLGDGRLLPPELRSCPLQPRRRSTPPVAGISGIAARPRSLWLAKPCRRDRRGRTNRLAGNVGGVAPRKPMQIEDILALLSAAPQRIAAAVEGLSPTQLQDRASSDEWSVNEILAHLRACADVRGGAALTILAEEHPTLRATDPRTYMETTDYLVLDFRTSVGAFGRQREELLKVLGALSRNGWERSATVIGAGKPLKRNVLFYAQWVAEHERPHLKQIARTAAEIRDSATH